MCLKASSSPPERPRLDPERRSSSPSGNYISIGKELKGPALQSLHWSMTPVLEWGACHATAKNLQSSSLDWKAITVIGIWTVRGTCLAFREASIKIELSSSPGTALLPPPLYTFPSPRPLARSQPDLGPLSTHALFPAFTLSRHFLTQFPANECTSPATLNHRCFLTI